MEETKAKTQEVEVEEKEEKENDFQTTEGASEAFVDDTKKTHKKNKKTKAELRIEELEALVAKLESDTAKDREAYLHAKADLENVRKRVEENAILERKYASLNLVSDLINPVDMLLKASTMETDNEILKNFLIGFQMIATQVMDVLKKDGLTEIEAKGKPFDSKVHQAMSKEHVDGVEPDQVLEVLQTGYKYKDRIVRPAMVKVSE